MCVTSRKRKESFNFPAYYRIFRTLFLSIKEFELRLKFETRLKYDWLHSKLCSMFQDLNRRSIATIFWRISDSAQIQKYLTQIVFSISRYFFLKANLFFHFIQF